MSKRIAGIAVGLACGLVMLCALLAMTVPAPATPTADRATLAIHNENWEYMRVYASEDGNSPYRITSVESMQDRKVPLSIHAGSFYCFVLIPLSGHDPYTTECVNVDAGDTLLLTIADHLPYSTLFREHRYQ